MYPGRFIEHLTKAFAISVIQSEELMEIRAYYNIQDIFVFAVNQLNLIKVLNVYDFKLNVPMGSY